MSQVAQKLTYPIPAFDWDAAPAGSDAYRQLIHCYDRLFDQLVSRYPSFAAIAAPQLGISTRMIVVPEERRILGEVPVRNRNYVALVNPVIVYVEGGPENLLLVVSGEDLGGSTRCLTIEGNQTLSVERALYELDDEGTKMYPKPGEVFRVNAKPTVTSASMNNRVSRSINGEEL